MHSRSWLIVAEISTALGLLAFGTAFYLWGIDAITSSPAVQHRRLAREAVTASDYESAISEYKMAVDADPGNAVVYYELGLAYERAGKTMEAIAAWAQALRIDPSLGQAEEAIKGISPPPLPFDPEMHGDSVPLDSRGFGVVQTLSLESLDGTRP